MERLRGEKSWGRRDLGGGPGTQKGAAREAALPCLIAERKACVGKSLFCALDDV